MTAGAWLLVALTIAVFGLSFLLWRGLKAGALESPNGITRTYRRDNPAWFKLNVALYLVLILGCALFAGKVAFDLLGLSNT